MGDHMIKLLTCLREEGKDHKTPLLPTVTMPLIRPHHDGGLGGGGGRGGGGGGGGVGMQLAEGVSNDRTQLSEPESVEEPREVYTKPCGGQEKEQSNSVVKENKEHGTDIETIIMLEDF
ncbi:zinc finger protein AEBP2 isoform X1 [Aplysia californica]|uniref:Zinc finger protein AEBP2 isoform X1 n=1 Tax=Aplysia californica TaxID=6500 RepID=A0ABM0JML5_APLCA|nr:zinc finger protein AEBP2 isoform X1 [Aplysia californica]